MSNKSPQELRQQFACINGYCHHNGKDCPIYESMCYRDEIDHEHKEDFEKMLDAMMTAFTSHMQAGFEYALEPNGRVGTDDLPDPYNIRPQNLRRGNHPPGLLILYHFGKAYAII